jgi:hypothetical protein
MSGETSTTTLQVASPVAATDTTITLSSTVGLAANGYIQLGNLSGEIIFYSYISGNTLQNCFRAQANTTASAYSLGAAVYVPKLPAITVWPTPDNSTTYTFAYWRLRRVQDAGRGPNVQDMNFRFLPAVAAGLAYHISMKVPELAQRVQMLKQAYDEQFDLAAGEDREKAAIRFVPRQQFLGSGGGAY